MTATEKELREYTAIRLADFKVPRKILLMDEIPKGATGKLQRIGIAQKLGLA
jgi:acyl-CoA synthetase (AMP-forming)/AMP-acid ligase II